MLFPIWRVDHLNPSKEAASGEADDIFETLYLSSVIIVLMKSISLIQMSFFPTQLGVV